MRKIPVGGGTPVTLAAAENPMGASWYGDSILVGQLNPPAILEIPADGGGAQTLVTLNTTAGEQARSPQLLADGRAVLFTLRSDRTEWDEASIVIHDLETRERKVLIQGGTDARVLPTGHLVYTRAGTLFAVQFDETTLQINGGPVPVQQGLHGARALGTSHVAWSASGTLAIVQGVGLGFLRPMVWTTRGDQYQQAALPPRNYGVRSSELRISPDGTRLAVSIYSDDVLRIPIEGVEVWVGDLTRGTLIRLSNTGQATSPVWTPDGTKVCYDSAGKVLCQAADGRGPAEASFAVATLHNTRPFSADGKYMLAETRGPTTGDDISIITLGPPVETRALLATASSETAPALSPDGRWLAYVSDESGRDEVYVRPFPAVDQGRWLISTGGGTEPRWARNGREIFYTVRSDWTAPGVLMSVPVKPGAAFHAGQPVAILKIPAGASEAYDVAVDGRFLFHLDTSISTASESPSSGEATSQQEVIVVQNWFEELKALVPTTK